MLDDPRPRLRVILDGYSMRPSNIRKSLLHDKPVDDCWHWTGPVIWSGYGLAGIPGQRGKHAGAHRVVWTLLNGGIPDGFHVDHTCHDPGTCKLGTDCPHRRCVNPAHLEAVPARDNVLRSSGPAAVNAGKTHCIHGHEFTTANTIVKHGHRSCRTCSILDQRRRREAKGSKPRAASRINLENE